MVAYVLIGWADVFLGLFSNWFERRECMLLPMSSFFSIAILTFYFEVQGWTNKFVVLLTFTSSLFFQFNFDSPMNGKSWLLLPLVILTVVFKLFSVIKKRSTLFAYMFGATLVAVSLLVTPQIYEKVESSENLKLLQASSMLNGRIDDMESSPRWRFVEFVNILNQNIENPLFGIIGRGIGGSIKNNGFFGHYIKGTFSEDQFANDKFYRMHESVNVIFLKGGFIGLILLLTLLLLYIRNSSKSGWFLIGFIWLLFFWGYGINLLFFGVPSIIIAWRIKQGDIFSSVIKL